MHFLVINSRWLPASPLKASDHPITTEMSAHAEKFLRQAEKRDLSSVAEIGFDLGELNLAASWRGTRLYLWRTATAKITMAQTLWTLRSPAGFRVLRSEKKKDFRSEKCGSGSHTLSPWSIQGCCEGVLKAGRDFPHLGESKRRNIVKTLQIDHHLVVPPQHWNTRCVTKY